MVKFGSPPNKESWWNRSQMNILWVCTQGGQGAINTFKRSRRFVVCQYQGVSWVHMLRHIYTSTPVPLYWWSSGSTHLAAVQRVQYSHMMLAIQLFEIGTSCGRLTGVQPYKLRQKATHSLEALKPSFVSVAAVSDRSSGCSWRRSRSSLKQICRRAFYFCLVLSDGSFLR